MTTINQTLARKRWSVVAIFPGETTWTTRIIDADFASPTNNGGLHLYNKGPKHTSPRVTVMLLAPDRWRDCEPAPAR